MSPLEAAAFKVGARIYHEDESTWNPDVPPLAWISPRLTAAERKCLLEMGDLLFKTWVDIGGVWSGLMEAINNSRVT